MMMGTIVRLSSAALLCMALPHGLAAAEASSAQPPPETDVSKQSGTLSDKLDATSGVIHPEGTVDPGMTKSPPATGTMPVIPPAGSPGGEPGVQPK